MNDTSKSWNQEYRTRGIPSSVRDEASTTVIWGLDNWRYISSRDTPRTALDVGCGTGRNAIYMASHGASVIGFDFSEEAIGRAQTRKASLAVPLGVDFVHHDLNDGLPADTGSLDLVTDIFVYKHQMDPSDRTRYRNEIGRVLRPDGKLLLSLAEIRDQYYSQCHLYRGSRSDDPLSVLDPAIDAGSVLYTLESLVREFGDTFRLIMSWLKAKDGLMHGQVYRRYTLATLWELKA